MTSCKSIWASALLGLLVLQPVQGQALLPITFAPADPSAGQAVTAILPFEICAWTIATSANRIDIDWIAAPCAAELFTDRVALGPLVAGTYSVYLEFAGPGAPVEQAVGTLVVAPASAAVALPVLQPAGLVTGCLGMIWIAIRALRRRGPTRTR